MPMRLFAISDLHLPGSGAKAMDVFGSNWAGHFDRIKQDWLKKVAPDDVTLLPGDFSWAMYLPDAMGDLAALDALPGRKILLRGNHDYWWSPIGAMRKMFNETYPSIMALQNDSIILARPDGVSEGVVVAGSRLWSYPDPLSPDFIEDDKIYKREAIRLELSLKDARKRAPDARLIVMTHYPPFRERYEPSPFTELIDKYRASEAVYGHLHGESGFGIGGSQQINGVWYHQTSCDGLDFRMRRLKTAFG